MDNLVLTQANGKSYVLYKNKTLDHPSYPTITAAQFYLDHLISRPAYQTPYDDHHGVWNAFGWWFVTIYGEVLKERYVSRVEAEDRFWHIMNP